MRTVNPSNIAVLGDGGWGTTLAIHLHRLGQRVRWWGAFPEYVRILQRQRENAKFLPGVRIPMDLFITDDLSCALEQARLIVLAVPSKYLRVVVRRLKTFALDGIAFLNVAKGIERETFKRMSEVIADEIGRAHV